MIKTFHDIKKTVIVIEDDEILLDSYRYFINSYDGYVLRGAFMNVNEALREYETIFPDIIISDISMPGMSGIEGLSKFKALDDAVKIIMVSVHDDLSYILDSIKNKADGYLTKPINKISLKSSLDALSNDGAPLSNDVSRKLISIFQKEKHAMFSDRENEIIELFTKGLTYKSIAEELFITASTVNFHIQNIYSKLEVKSKSEALKKITQLSKTY